MRSWTSATPSEVAEKELWDMKEATPGTLMNWVGCVPSSPRGQDPNWATVNAAPSVSMQMPSAAAIFMGWASTISWPCTWPEATVPRPPMRTTIRPKRAMGRHTSRACATASSLPSREARTIHQIAMPATKEPATSHAEVMTWEYSDR